MHLMEVLAEETGGGQKRAKDMMEGQGVSIILKSIDVKFKRPVTYPDTLLLSQRPHNTSSSRFTLSTLIYSLAQQAPVAECEAVCVWYDYDAWKKCNAPEDLGRALESRVTK